MNRRPSRDSDASVPVPPARPGASQRQARRAGAGPLNPTRPSGPPGGNGRYERPVRPPASALTRCHGTESVLLWVSGPGLWSVVAVLDGHEQHDSGSASLDNDGVPLR